MNNILEINNLNFSYSEYDYKTGLSYEGPKVLSDISFKIKEGSFVTLCGPTGCGKSTLLKLLKRDLKPFGTLSGEIIFDGQNINELDAKSLASSIGFMFQNPEDQIVTDKVWHEIVFGLENLGFSQSDMELRLAEMLTYFHIDNISKSETASLSGGQKQIVSLASVLSMYPKLLLLDEPLSMLDPEAAEQFIIVIKKLQSSLGLTVIIAEHNLNDLLSISDTLLFMKEGKLICCDETNSALKFISKSESNPEIFDLPLQAKIGMALDSSIPLDISAGRTLLKEYTNSADSSSEINTSQRNSLEDLFGENSSENSSNKKNIPDFISRNIHFAPLLPHGMEDKTKYPAISLKNICFRYEKNAPDILDELSANFESGKIYAILGSNASGKSTILNLMSGSIKNQLGKITPSLKKLKIAYLPQNIEDCFICETVEKELSLSNIKRNEFEDFLINIPDTASPLDLSGGQKQLLGLVKISSLKPDILLLDEPTKGCDYASKYLIMKMLRKLSDLGKTIIIASHDMDFVANCADECSIMSMGKLTTFKRTGEFFLDNMLYTTSARKLTRDIFNNIY